MHRGRGSGSSANGNPYIFTFIGSIDFDMICLCSLLDINLPFGLLQQNTYDSTENINTQGS